MVIDGHQQRQVDRASHGKEAQRSSEWSLRNAIIIKALAESSLVWPIERFANCFVCVDAAVLVHSEKKISNRSILMM